MAIRIHPGDMKIQAFGETVTYELPWEAWDQDLANASREFAVIQEVLAGSPCTVTALPEDHAKRVSRIQVRSSVKGGHYQITRTVTTKSQFPEQRRRSFQVLVEGR